MAALNPPITTTPDEDVPSSFSEIADTSDNGSCCRICAEPATHRMALVVRLPGAGTGKSGTPPSVASHRQDYCEAHAVSLFVKVKKAMR